MTVASINTHAPRSVPGLGPHPRSTHAIRHRRSPDRANPYTFSVTVEVTLAGGEHPPDPLEIVDTLRRATNWIQSDRSEGGPRYHLALSHGVGVVGVEGAERAPVARPAGAAAAVARAADPDVIRVRPSARLVTHGLAEVELTRLEFDLLQFLAENRLRAYSRLQLLDHVWGHRRAGMRTIDVHIARIRAKLGSPDAVVTVRGVGYRLGEHVNIQLIDPTTGAITRPGAH